MEDEPRETEPTPAPGRTRRSFSATGRGVRRAGRATGSAASYTMRQARRASHAEGAGDTGLFRLIELHAVNAAGDAAVAIALAGTLFFAQPGEARGHIALFLGLTMLPFAVVAPLLGPFLDRFSHGRRWAIGSTMAIRAFLCWLMADAVASNSIAMYPTALGVLVSSKAYGVARAATVPRLLPSGLTLVKANSRISLAGVVGAAISAPLAAGAADLRRGVGAALRLRGLRGRDHPLRPAAGPGRCHRRRAAGEPERRPQEVPGPAVGRVRAAVQRRAADALGLPDHVHGLPAPPAPAAGLGGQDDAADGPGDRRGRARQHHRDRPGVGAPQGDAVDHRGRSPCSRTSRPRSSRRSSTA